MLKKNQAALMVKVGEGWKYVLYVSPWELLTTPRRERAEEEEFLEYYQNRFPDKEFKIEEKGE